MAEKLEFKTMQEFADQFDLKDKGSYFMCTCPACNRREAFTYKSKDFYVVKCNRTNNCGYEGHIRIEAHNRVISNTEQNISSNFKDIDRKHLKGFFEYVSQYSKISEAYVDYFQKRMLDVSNIEHTFYIDDGQKLFDALLLSLSDLNAEVSFEYLQRKYKNEESKLDLTKYNIWSVVKNADEVPEYISLRSTEQLQKKEIKLKLTDHATRDFFSSSNMMNDKIFITEGLFDAMSIKEILNQDISYFSLTGVRNQNHLMNELMNNKYCYQQSMFVICFDSDKTGVEYAQKLQEKLKLNGLQSIIYTPLDGMDINDMLMKNPQKLKNDMEEIIMTELARTNDQEIIIENINEKSVVHGKVQSRSAHVKIGEYNVFGNVKTFENGNSIFTVPEKEVIKGDEKKYFSNVEFDKDLHELINRKVTGLVNEENFGKISEYVAYVPEELQKPKVFLNGTFENGIDYGNLSVNGMTIKNVTFPHTKDGKEFVSFPTGKPFTNKENEKVYPTLVSLNKEQSAAILEVKESVKLKLVERENNPFYDQLNSTKTLKPKM